MHARKKLPGREEVSKGQLSLALARAPASFGKLRMRNVVMCGLRLQKAPDDPLGPEQLTIRPRWCRTQAQLGQLILGPGAVIENLVGTLPCRQAGATAEMAQSFLDEETAWIHVAEVSAPTNFSVERSE